MFVLAPLRRPPIFILWSSQVLAGTGDEFFRIAVVWIAAGLIGADAGYLSGAQFLASLTFSFAAGLIADHWDRRRLLVGSEIARAAIALAVPVVAYAGTLSIWHLLFVAVAVTGLRSFILTGSLAALPTLTANRDELFATNGLLDGVRRLARIVGPALVGILAAVVPVPHLLTITAGTFAASAAAFWVLGDRLGGARRNGGASRRGLRRMLMQLAVTARAVGRNALMRWSLLTLMITDIAWTTVFTLGLVLHIQRTMPGDIGAYGAVLAAYGVGNLGMNMLVASMRVRRFGLVMFGGRVCYGLGIIGMGLAPDLTLMMAAACFSSFGGPMNDVPFLTLMQRDFPASQHGQVYSMRIFADSLGLLVGAVISSELLAVVPVKDAIVMAGIFATAVGLVALVRFWRE